MHRKIDGIIVEWDISKNNSNIIKHKLSFETAALVFADSNRIEFYDSLHSECEDRYRVIGVVNDIIVVIYTERKEALRIISARFATMAERKIYYEKNSSQNH